MRHAASRCVLQSSCRRPIKHSPSRQRGLLGHEGLFGRIAFNEVRLKPWPTSNKDSSTTPGQTFGHPGFTSRNDLTGPKQLPTLGHPRAVDEAAKPEKADVLRRPWTSLLFPWSHLVVKLEELLESKRLHACRCPGQGQSMARPASSKDSSCIASRMPSADSSQARRSLNRSVSMRENRG